MPPKVKETAIAEVQVFSLDNLNPALLPELSTFKEIQLKVVQDNPFVIITDTASRDLAKKYRTARVSARTALQGQDKLISSKFNDAKTKAKSYIAELIDISLPGEKQQQEEIDRDEAEAELKRQEKARLEQQRIDNIKKELEDYAAEWKTTFSIMSFETIEQVGADFLESYTTYDLTVLEEFEPLFPSKIEELTQYLSNKTYSLTEAENARLEKERIQAEAKKLSEEKAEFEAKKNAIEAENKRKESIKESISDYHFAWERKVSVLMDYTYLECLASFEKGSDANYEEFQDEFLHRKEIIKKSFIDRKALIDFEKQQRITSEELAKEKEEFAIEQEKVRTENERKSKELAQAIAKLESDKKQNEQEESDRLAELNTTVISYTVEPTANVCIGLPQDVLEIVHTIDTYSKILETQILTEMTWDSIALDFTNSGGKSYSKWLKENYNVPTKIQ